MNKKRLWLLAISVATMVTANGIVLAATTDKQEQVNGKWQQTQSEKGDFGKRGRPPMGFHEDRKALLEFLKLDEQSFREKAQGGKTLAEIAKDQDISEQALTDFLVEQMTARIDKAEKEGHLPPDTDAAKMKAGISERVAEMINGKMPMHRPGHMRAPFDDTKLLELLKIDKEAFRTEMQEGKTLAAIAKEHNVSEQKLKTFMTKQLTERITEDVKAGRLTEERAKEMKTNMDKHITDMINGKMHRPEHRPMGPGPFHNEKLLSLLNLDAKGLKTEMKAGKNLLTIAEEHGVSEQALKETLKNQMTQHLDQGVNEGKIPADKAQEMKNDMDKRIDDMIHGKAPMKPHHQAEPQPQE
ncbi:MAG: hypothetical protein H6Q72_3542 [Firmicutes bacterium]|nr:hypothetical protein [Bacillota bacterium]